jgi:hypothetical protein
MVQRPTKIKVYLEAGKKRVFAGAIEWPGWCRSGQEEASALQALLDYGPRYTKALREVSLDFEPPVDRSAFQVVEKVQGNSTTDFGAPAIAPASDSKPLSGKELGLWEDLLRACWQALNSSRKAARRHQLKTGPRGGGRQTEQIMRHVMGADLGYLGALGSKLKVSDDDISQAALKSMRAAMLEGIEASARGEIPPTGPRGGTRWTARYFVRRVVWHTLDHAWEIEDRI